VLEIVPVTFREACAFVDAHHRTQRRPNGMKLCLAVSDGEKIVGVAIVARPVARKLDDGWTLEVARTCTDGTKNTNSMLYGARWRAVRAIGYRRLITYTLPEEGGASLRAAEFKLIGEGGDRGWSRAGHPCLLSARPGLRAAWKN
jgi:hypothetical protein